jgi:hypothetical protein
MDTKPGDLMGPDSHGDIRISREIPLPWLVGIAVGLFVQAASVWFGQQQMAKDVIELKATIRQASDTLAAMTGKDIEHSLKLIEMDRRINALEVKAGKL